MNYFVCGFVDNLLWKSKSFMYLDKDYFGSG
jgi:hypothetical protein